MEDKLDRLKEAHRTALDELRRTWDERERNPSTATRAASDAAFDEFEVADLALNGWVYALTGRRIG